MTDFQYSLISTRLAKRVQSTHAERDPIQFKTTPSQTELHEHLRQHLAAGETHYTTRPGLTELREAIGREIGRMGGTDHNADGVIVTQGEGEALYVTLLGLGIGEESVVAVNGECHHRGLLNLLGIKVIGTHDPGFSEADAGLFSLEETFDGTTAAVPENMFEIVTLGGLLFSKEMRDAKLGSISHDAILIGHLDSLSGLDHFRMGYVTGPSEIVKRIQTWKQALSICSAAPSQRAAMYAISKGGVS